MQHRLTWLAAIPWLAFGIAFARGANPPAATPGTGDAWVDATLLDIDRYAARYPDAFTDEMVRYHGAPRELVGELLLDRDWSAGDIYFACTLAQFAGQPCRNAVAQRERDASQDWQAIAQRFGVASDTDAFHRIKRAIVLSYQRWARPLKVDASLHAEFPQHDVAPAAPRPVPGRVGGRP